MAVKETKSLLSPRRSLVVVVVWSLCLMLAFAFWTKNGSWQNVDKEKDRLTISQQQQLQQFKPYIQRFYETAMNHTPITDKVTDHSYHQMYGTFLMPLYESLPDNNMTMLEIGLGCNMAYGPGASVELWKELFPRAELWEADYDRDCVEKAQMKGQLDGIHVIVGDQGDNEVLDRWIAETGGGHFDVVIDDGGHTNRQIKRSFDKFWPALNPGGLYFIEDLQVGRDPGYVGDDPTLIMSEVLQDWIEQLIYSPTPNLRRPTVHLLPADVAFVACQTEACVVGKKNK